jgi:hypothetical protein
MKERSPELLCDGSLTDACDGRLLCRHPRHCAHQLLIKDEVYTVWIERDAPSNVGVPKAV